MKPSTTGTLLKLRNLSKARWDLPMAMKVHKLHDQGVDKGCH